MVSIMNWSKPIFDWSLNMMSILGVTTRLSSLKLSSSIMRVFEYFVNSKIFCSAVDFWAFATFGEYWRILKCLTEFAMSLATNSAVISLQLLSMVFFSFSTPVLLEFKHNASAHQSRSECAVTEKLKKWSIRLLSSVSNRRRLPSLSNLISKSFGRSNPVIFDIKSLCMTTFKHYDW